jgi:SAM-dependent methyltransferase
VGFYSRHILPRLIDRGCGTKPVRKQRKKVVPLAAGRVLEVGIGTGLNLSFYDPAKVDCVIGLDPAREMLLIAQSRDKDVPFHVDYVAPEGSEIPLDDGSVDTVLITYTLCTILESVPALDGMRRVLKPGGRLIFCEHGKGAGCGCGALAKSPDAPLAHYCRWLLLRPRHSGADHARRLPSRQGRDHVPAQDPRLCRLQLLGCGRTEQSLARLADRRNVLAWWAAGEDFGEIDGACREVRSGKLVLVGARCLRMCRGGDEHGD